MIRRSELTACDHARDTRDRAHAASCPACRAHLDLLDELSGAIDRLPQALDDVGRARIEARVLAALEAPARARRWPWLLGPALVAAAAVLVVVLGSPVPGPSSLGLTPRVLAGFAAPPELVRAMLAEPLERVEVPAGGRAELQLGHVLLALEGPGALVRVPDAEGTTRVRLERGRVMVDVEHDEGRHVVVEAGAIAVEVVGTRFLVEREPDERVAVARGHVRVRERLSTGEAATARDVVAAGRIVAELGAGQAWTRERGSHALDEGSARGLSALRAEHPSNVGLIEVVGAPGLSVRLYGGATLGSTPLWAALTPGRVALEVLDAGGALFAAPIADVREGVATQVQIVVAHPPASARPESTPAASPARVREGQLLVAPPPGVGAPAGVRTSTHEHLSERPTAEEYYRRAELAMKRGASGTARAELSALVEQFPGDILVSSARYELARLSAEAGDRHAARLHLASLLEQPGRDVAITELARVLACVLDTDEGRADVAIACWTTLRADYPRSPHDRRALVELARLGEARGGCVEARPWLELLVGLYPRDEAGRAASERLLRCGR